MLKELRGFSILAALAAAVATFANPQTKPPNQPKLDRRLHDRFQNDPALRPWLLEVSSQYSVEGEKKAVRITGSGFVLCDLLDGKIQFYLASASHVTGGQQMQVRVRLEDQSVELKARPHFVDGFADLSTFKLDGDDPALLLELCLARLHRHSSTLIVERPVTRSWREDFFKELLPGISQSLGETTQVPLPIWAKAFEIKASPSSTSQNLFYTGFGDELVSVARVPRGSSGGPVLQYMPFDDQTYLLGSALRKTRYFESSFFSTASKIYEMIESGLRGDDSPSRSIVWQMENGILYRIQPTTASAEINRSTFFNGNGGSVDGGNGGSVDGGGEDGDARAVLPIADVSTEIIYRNETIIAFQIPASSHVQKAFMIPAYFQALGRKELSDWTPITQGSKIPPIIAARFNRKLPFNVEIEGARLEVTEEGIRLELHQSNGDRIQVRLNEFGSQDAMGQSFKSLVVTQSELGHGVILDLANFVFHDPYQMRIPMNFAGRSSESQWWNAELQDLAPSITFKVNGAVEEISF